MLHLALQTLVESAVNITKLLATITWLAFALPSLAVSPASAEDHGFDATYRLYASGLPDAQIQHRLTKTGHRVESTMLGSALAVATGKERSSFLDDGKHLTPLFYASDYGVMGYQKHYRLSPKDLEGQMDRQMMLYQLSRDARAQRCLEKAPCSLRYVDHKARQRRIRYYQVTHPTPEDLSVRYPVTLNVFEQGREDPLRMSFHPEQPGLIVEAEMRRGDGREYRLVLRDVVFD